MIDFLLTVWVLGSPIAFVILVRMLGVRSSEPECFPVLVGALIWPAVLPVALFAGIACGLVWVVNWVGDRYNDAQ